MRRRKSRHELSVLLALGNRERSMPELARLTGRPAVATSRTVDRLIERGLVGTYTARASGKVLYALTAAGRAAA